MAQEESEFERGAKWAFLQATHAINRIVVTATDGQQPHAIRFSDYEIANLRAIIEAIGYPVPFPLPEGYFNNPLSVLNSGDWIGQIYLKLPAVDTPPNHTPAFYREQARKKEAAIPRLKDAPSFYDLSEDKRCVVCGEADSKTGDTLAAWTSGMIVGWIHETCMFGGSELQEARAAAHENACKLKTARNVITGAWATLNNRAKASDTLKDLERILGEWMAKYE